MASPTAEQTPEPGFETGVWLLLLPAACMACECSGACPQGTWQWTAQHWGLCSLLRPGQSARQLSSCAHVAHSQHGCSELHVVPKA